MSLLRRALDNTLERRGADGRVPWGDSTPPSNGSLGGGQVAGTKVDDTTAMGIASVWSCMGILSDAVSTLPLRQYRGSGTGRREMDLASVLADPWPECTALDWRSQGTISLALRGNFFGLIVERDRNMVPTMIQPLDPDSVKPGRSDSGELQYKIGQDVSGAEDVLHIRNITRPGSIVGYNPIELLRLSLGLARAADQYGAAFFGNSANPSGVLSTTEDLSEEETLELARSWIQSHQGIGSSNMPAVLTGGMTWQQVSITPEDAQFIASRQFSRSEIAMIWRIPPHMIGDIDRSTSWGQGIEQQELGFTRVTLGGYLRRWETALSAMLPRGQYVRFDLRARLRGDTLQRFNAWNLAHLGGWMTANQIADEEDLPHLPGDIGDRYLEPLNIGAAGTQDDPMPVTVPPTGSQGGDDK